MSYNSRGDPRRYYRPALLPMGYNNQCDSMGYKMNRSGYSSNGPPMNKSGPLRGPPMGNNPSSRGPPQSSLPLQRPLQNSPQPQAPPTPDPSSYTQPAYSTQPGYTGQQPSPKPTPQQPPQERSSPAQVVKETPEEAPSNQPTEDVSSDQEKWTPGPRPWLKKGVHEYRSQLDKMKVGNEQKSPQILDGNIAYNMRVSKKIRKRRQNARLRHILAPKNAMMVLHELHPELKIVATEQLNAANQMVYTVDIEIEGKTYRGHGMSKLAAKQAGCENALKAVLLEKMAKSNVKVTQDDENAEAPVKMETNEITPPNPTEQNSEGADAEKPTSKRQYAEDDVPWGSLASFALYKLFSEWQSQGFQLPATNNPPIPPVILQKLPGFGMSPMKKIPEDANKKHPVQLLNQLRPGSQYSETREGTPPNLTFTFTVVVDGQTYKGVGTSKKDAKKECAKAALEAMGVKYD